MVGELVCRMPRSRGAGSFRHPRASSAARDVHRSLNEVHMPRLVEEGNQTRIRSDLIHGLDESWL